MPAEGGKVTEKQRASRSKVYGPTRAWAKDTEATLLSQAPGKEWEYRVIAFNKVGEGVPSNTVIAVL